MNQDPEIGQEIDIDVQEPLAMIVEETTALDPTPEIYLVRDLGKEMREETVVKNMNQDSEIGQEIGIDVQEPLAMIIEEKTALDPTPELVLKRDLGKEMRVETTVRNMNQDPEIDQEMDTDVQEPLAMTVEETTALDPTPELYLVRDLGKEMKEETVVKNMNQDPEIGQEIGINVQEPLAMIIEENTALDPTPELILERDLGKEMREETTVRNMNQDPEIDQEIDTEVQEPLAMMMKKIISTMMMK